MNLRFLRPSKKDKIIGGNESACSPGEIILNQHEDFRKEKNHWAPV
jgi:hypothetical protein